MAWYAQYITIQNQVIYFWSFSFWVFMLFLHPPRVNNWKWKRERHTPKKKKTNGHQIKYWNGTINQTCNEPFEIVVSESFFLTLIQFWYSGFLLSCCVFSISFFAVMLCNLCSALSLYDCCLNARQVLYHVCMQAMNHVSHHKFKFHDSYEELKQKKKRWFDTVYLSGFVVGYFPSSIPTRNTNFRMSCDRKS